MPIPANCCKHYRGILNLMHCAKRLRDCYHAAGGLTYDPHDQNLRASGHDPLYVTIGKDH